MSDILRTLAALPKGDPIRRKLLAAFKAGGSELRILAGDLLARYGVEPDVKSVPVAAKALAHAFRQAARESAWVHDGPGSESGFKRTGKRAKGYAYLAGGHKTYPGSFSEPPEYDDIEDAEFEYDAEFIAGPEPMLLEAADILKAWKAAASGLRIRGNDTKPLVRTLLEHRTAVGHFVADVVGELLRSKIARKVVEEAVEDALYDLVMDSIKFVDDPGVVEEVQLHLRDYGFKQGTPKVTRNGVVVPVITTIRVEAEVKGRVDYNDFDRYASVRHHLLRQASVLPKGDPVRRRLLARAQRLFAQTR